MSWTPQAGEGAGMSRSSGRLSPAGGVLVAVLIVLPFWAAIVVLLWRRVSPWG
jgi:hypothetical protein